MLEIKHNYSGIYLTLFGQFQYVISFRYLCHFAAFADKNCAEHGLPCGHINGSFIFGRCSAGIRAIHCIVSRISFRDINGNLCGRIVLSG